MNINLLIELKKEYTTHLLNILSPVIFSGLASIYCQAKKNVEHNTVLKTFQSCLKKIPNWDVTMIEKECKRIIEKTKTTWLVDLTKAVIKANIVVLSVNDIPTNVYEELTFGKFIHNVYIECAREFWIDPYLFYHECSSMEIKRNNIIIIKTIRNCIENAIRKTLPMQIILKTYLGANEETDKEFDFDNMSKAEMMNIPLLLQKDIKATEQKQYHTSHVKTESDNTNNKILQMIERQDIKLSESNDKTKNTPERSIQSGRSINSSSNKKSSSTLKRIINESVNKTHNNSTRSLSIDSKMKNKLTKNLADSDTMTYHPEENVNNYQDIFSNSDIKPKSTSDHSTRNNETLDTQEKNDKKSRDKFFNNYLNI